MEGELKVPKRRGRGEERWGSSVGWLSRLWPKEGSTFLLIKDALRVVS